MRRFSDWTQDIVRGSLLTDFTLLRPSVGWTEYIGVVGLGLNGIGDEHRDLPEAFWKPYDKFLTDPRRDSSVYRL